MKVFIFRHAQKAMDFSGDPDLNTQGFAQAENLLKAVSAGKLPTPSALWVSPKKRTQSTFRPLSSELNLPLVVKKDLLEQQGHETVTDFRGRLQDLLLELSHTEEKVLFLCSHYDVTVELMGLISSDKDLGESAFSHWQSCQYIGFDIVDSSTWKFLCYERISS